MIIVGVDCATDPKKTGLARATLEGSNLEVHEARVAKNRDDIITTVSEWMSGEQCGVLALDAPLGWPKPMLEALAGHRAGLPIEVPRQLAFQRATDRVVHRALGKKPLEVGANLIAHTAHEALGQLADIRNRVPIEMGWTPGEVDSRQVIEVYPAATLIGRSIPASKYKAADASPIRSEILRKLGVTIDKTASETAVAVDHVLDAVIACVGAADYALGNVVAPEDPDLAKTEGWIWFKPKSDF